jgi:plastocyanin
MRKLIVLLLGCVVVLSNLAGPTPGQDKKAGKTHKVLMVDDEFKPKKLEIAVGDTIIWVNKGKKTHAASSEEKVPKALAFDTDDIEPGDSSKPVTFKKAGEVPYNCFHHRNMKGVIIVKAKKG